MGWVGILKPSEQYNHTSSASDSRVLQVLAIEFVLLAVDFVPLANEFVVLANKFVLLAIEFVALAFEFVALARKFVGNKIGSWSEHENKM